jgi:hypothetical protein
VRTDHRVEVLGPQDLPVSIAVQFDEHVDEAVCLRLGELEHVDDVLQPALGSTAGSIAARASNATTRARTWSCPFALEGGFVPRRESLLPFESTVAVPRPAQSHRGQPTAACICNSPQAQPFRLEVNSNTRGCGGRRAYPCAVICTASSDASPTGPARTSVTISSPSTRARSSSRDRPLQMHIHDESRTAGSARSSQPSAPDVTDDNVAV